MTSERENVLRRCLNIASNDADVSVVWKTVRAVCAKNQKSPFADGGQVGGSRSESLPGE